MTDPDFLAKDGIFSGFYRPPPNSNSVTYRVSVRLDGYRSRNPLPFNYNEGRLLPTDQGTTWTSFKFVVKTLISRSKINKGNYCCGSMFTLPGTSTTFLRYYPYVASLQAKSTVFYEVKFIYYSSFL